MRDYKIIVAKYKEDVSWLREFSPDQYVIYNKGERAATAPHNARIITRKNVGREAETFMYHILANYDNLSDFLVVVQGIPFDHTYIKNAREFRTALDNHPDPLEITPLFAHPSKMYMERESYEEAMHVEEYYRLFFEDSGTYDENRGFVAGCQYIIPKRAILARPRAFYQRLHMMLINRPEDNTYHNAHYESIYDPYFITGWTYERFLGLTFDPARCKTARDFAHPRTLVVFATADEIRPEIFMPEKQYVCILPAPAPQSTSNVFFISADDPDAFEKAGFVDEVIISDAATHAPQYLWFMEHHVCPKPREIILAK
jgi:hypothetical protein